MHILRSILMIMTTFLCLSHMAYAQKFSKQAVRDFVTERTNDVITVLKENEGDLIGRKEGFEKIFLDGGDVPKIARFVSGKAWKKSDKKTQNEYVETYRAYMAYTYAARITKYNNEQVTVGRVTSRGKGFLVDTKLVIPETNNGMRIIWQLSIKDNALKITDLKVENISMSLTQRAEFTSFLKRNNNDLNTLTSLLKERLSRLEKQNKTKEMKDKSKNITAQAS